jgi:protein-arginine kinase activator protein McsA
MMHCQACKERSATIHLTEINNGQRCETHLCRQCAQQQGLSVKSKIPLNELMNSLLSSQQEKASQAEAPSEPGAAEAEAVCQDTFAGMCERLCGIPAAIAAADRTKS